MRLCSSDYEEIEECVADMYEDLGYADLPVDVFALCDLLKIKLVKYSELKPEAYACIDDLSKDGFMIFDYNNSCYKIYYNDDMLYERIRFTIMHEIGHIMLGHKKHSVENEQKANAFARIALAPLGMIYVLRLKDVYEVADAFDISIDFSEHVVNHYNNAIIWGSIREKVINSRLVMIFEKSKDMLEVG